MASDDYFLDRETEHWRITAMGQDRLNAFVTLQSKTSGEIIPHFTRDLYAERPETKDTWENFLGGAEVLDGDALDEHLSHFAPIDQLHSQLHISQGPWRTLPGRFHNPQGMPITVATLLNVTKAEDPVEMARQCKEAMTRLAQYPWEDDDTTEKANRLGEYLSLMHDSLQRDAAAGRRSFYGESFAREIGEQADSLGLLDKGARDYKTSVAFRNLITALHFENLNIHQGLGVIELSSAHRLPFVKQDAPYMRAVREMALGKAPLIPDQDIDDSGLFGGRAAIKHHASLYPPPGKPNWTPKSIYSSHFYSIRESYSKGGAPLALNLLSGCDTPEEKRNVFQFFKAFKFHSGVIDTPHLGHDRLSDHWDEIKRGTNLSALLWSAHANYVNEGRDPLSFAKDKFGKKEARLLMDNLIGLNRIDAFGIEGEVRTMHGERMVITPYSRRAMMGLDAQGNPDPTLGMKNLDPPLANSRADRETAENEARYAHVEFSDKEGQVVFSGNFNLQRINDEAPIAFLMMDMPPNTLTRIDHLFALAAVSKNPVLAKDMVAGGLQLRDRQIKKAQDYNGAWTSMIHRIDKALEGHDVGGSSHAVRQALRHDKSFEDYQNATSITDAQGILATTLNAVKLSYLTEIESHYANVDALINDNYPDTHRFKVYGRPYELETTRVLPGMDRLSYNAKLALADKAHKEYNALRKAASPEVALEWTPALPEMTFEVPGQSPITLTAVTSHADVAQEGDDMAHCVGSYASKCVRGEYLVFSVTQAGEKIATLGMHTDGHSAEFDQLQGFRNGPVDDAVGEVVMSQFVEPLQTDGAVHGHALKVATPESVGNQLTRRQLLSLQMDFEIFDDAKMALCRDYLTNLLPRDEVVDQVEREIDHQIAFYTSHPRTWDKPGYFTAELNQLERNRERLREDFAMAPPSELSC